MRVGNQEKTISNKVRAIEQIFVLDPTQQTHTIKGWSKKLKSTYNISKNNENWKISMILLIAALSLHYRGLNYVWFAYSARVIFWYLFSEAVARRCSVKKVFLEISQNSQENNCVRVSFLIKLQSLLKKRLWHCCFPVNFAKFLRIPFLTKTSGGCMQLFWNLPVVYTRSFIIILREIFTFSWGFDVCNFVQGTNICNVNLIV